ncbi:glycosyltransferase [Polymorphobacter sp.]|uniref:glycosyltransferase n=1 Tax=Polymorphobacter sp. TaxID=1909290 RepID=UPI003F6FF3DD
MSSFVSVGNATQPFPRLIAAVMKHAVLLPLPLVVQHGSTPGSLLGPLPGGVPFLSMAAFEAEVARARLLILHAGAGSVIHAVRAGKRPVVMPRRQHLGEHVDDHQLEFARALSASGHVILAETEGDLPDAIAAALAAPAGASQNDSQSPMLQMVTATLARHMGQRQ